MKDGKLIGSELIGQKFDSSIYFWSRPSAIDYNPVPSGASNFGPTSNKLKKQVSERQASFAARNSITDITAIPKEMIFASASGLDPHISLAAALYQAGRISRVRHLPIEKVQQLISEYSEGMLLGFLGEPRVNVLALNLALDAAH